MLIAFNSKGQLIHANQADPQEQYFCPEPFVPMEVRISSRARPYFAKINHRGSGESQEHQLGKRQIHEWCRQMGWPAQLEVPVKSIDQRIDVLARVNQHKLAFEFQCSPISNQRLSERTQYCWQMGYQVYWLLGSPYQPLTRKQQAKFTQWELGQPVIYWWDVKGGQLHKQFIQLQPCKSQYHQELTRLKWHRQQGGRSKLLNLAYQNHHQLWLCPNFLHNWQENWPITELHLLEWQIQLLLSLERLAVGTKWTPASWFQWIDQQTRWLPMPCLTPPQKLSLHRSLISRLTYRWTKAGIVQVNQQEIKYIQRPYWYADEQEKKRHLRTWCWD